MITAKYKTQNQPRSPGLLFNEWVLSTLSTFCMTVVACLNRIFSQISVALRNIQASLSTFYEFVRLSLIANGLYPLVGFVTKPSRSASLYLTDDELETCLEYADHSSNSSPEESPSWSAVPHPAHSFDQSFYAQHTHDSSSSNADLDHGSALYVSKSNLSNENLLDATCSASNSISLPLPSTLPNATVPQPESDLTTEKREESSNASSDTKNDESIHQYASSSSSNETKLPLKVSQPMNTKKFDHKSTKSEPVISSFSSLETKRDHSLVSGTLPLDSASSAASSRSAALQDMDAGPKLTKKQKQSRSGHKKKASDAAAPVSPPRKSKTVAPDTSLEDKGFKLVSKKSKRRKNLSMDKSMEKIMNKPVPVPTSTTAKLPASAVPLKERHVSLGHKKFMENETGVISEIMNTALLDMNQISVSDQSDVSSPPSECYTSSASPVSSRSSPVSVHWPIDSRFFGNNGYHSAQALGLEPSSAAQPVWTMKPPQTNFSNNQLHLQNHPLPFYFPSDPCSYPVALSPHLDDNGVLDSGMFGQPSVNSSTSSPLLISAPLSPNPATLAPTSIGMKRRNTRVTNSTLTWSVPAHMSNI